MRAKHYQTKHVPPWLVVYAARRAKQERQEAQAHAFTVNTAGWLMSWGVPIKVALAAIHRETKRGSVDWGTSPHSCWATPEADELAPIPEDEPQALVWIWTHAMMLSLLAHGELTA